MKPQTILLGLTFAASSLALPNILHPTAPLPPPPVPTEYQARDASPEIAPANNYRRLPQPEHGADWPRLPEGYKRHEDVERRGATPPHHPTHTFPPLPPPGPTGFIQKRGARPPNRPDFPHPPGGHPPHPPPPGPTGGYPSHEPFRFAQRGVNHDTPPMPPYPTGTYPKRDANTGHGNVPYPPPPAPTGGYPQHKRSADGVREMPRTPPRPTGYPGAPDHPPHHGPPGYNFPKLMPRV